MDGRKYVLIFSVAKVSFRVSCNLIHLFRIFTNYRNSAVPSADSSVPQVGTYEISGTNEVNRRRIIKQGFMVALRTCPRRSERETNAPGGARTDGLHNRCRIDVEFWCTMTRL